MCGIAGLVATDPHRPVEAGPVEAMLACLRHRGPDEGGLFTDEGVVLGHRRLSIIDPEHGRQPLRGGSAQTRIVANGEVYNFRELREVLERRGHVFRTRSDSEVAAHAYDAWDLTFLDRLEGMYALAIWDGRRRRLVLVRDRMGQKPLYYGTFDGLLVFASELRALVEHPAVSRRLDPEALSQYLCLEYVPAPRSLLAGVQKLEPGTALVVEDGETRLLRYWTPPLRRQGRGTAPAAVGEGPEEEEEEEAGGGVNGAGDRGGGGAALKHGEAVERLRELLDEAVRSRLVADVPLGIFLSGGIDSSTVAALAARHGALDTFSIGFEEPSFDESAYARAMAERIGSRHHERVVERGEMSDLVPELGRLLDEPIGDASIVPTTLLSRFARERVKVALGGDGGDELFAGYPMHRAHRVAPLARLLPEPLHRAARAAAGRLPVSHGNFTTRFKVLSFLRGAHRPPPANHVLWMSSFSPDEQERLLVPELLETVDPETVALAPAERVWAASEGAPTLLRAMHLDARTYLPHDVLTKVDRASMSVGLEVRAPFLQRDVVELAFRLPASYHMWGLTGKRLLREATRDLLPDEVRERPKKGFGMPVAAWLQDALAPLVDDLLGADAVRRAGLFRPDEVERLVREHRERREDHRKPLWTLLVFELWRREMLEGR